MGLFDAWFGAGGAANPLAAIVQNASPAAQNAGFVNPQDNITSRLANFVKAYQQATQQHLNTPQIQQQAGQMLPPVTFQAPGMQGGQGGSVDFARGPSPGGWGGY